LFRLPRCSPVRDPDGSDGLLGEGTDGESIRRLARLAEADPPV
jgi:hypothetical protein